MTDWCWYKDNNTKAVFIHLLLKANSSNKVTYAEGGIPIKRGQVAISYSTLCSELGMTERQIRTAISHLLATQSVTVSKRGKKSIYTIVSYADYQPDRHDNDTQSDRQSDTSSYKDKNPSKEGENKTRPLSEGGYKRNGSGDGIRSEASRPARERTDERYIPLLKWE